MNNLIHRLVVALASVLAGFYASKDQLSAAKQQLEQERQVNADLHKQILDNAGENALLKQVTETAQADLKKLQDQYAQDTAEAAGVIDKAEKAAAEVNDDPQIPIAVDNGEVIHDADAPLPQVVTDGGGKEDSNSAGTSAAANVPGNTATIAAAGSAGGDAAQ